jgi:hypothetical protein
MYSLNHTGSLLRDLADHDARQLLDIGLVRGEDGALRLAADPVQEVTQPVARRTAIGLIGSIKAFLKDVPAVRLPQAMVSR